MAYLDSCVLGSLILQPLTIKKSRRKSRRRGELQYCGSYSYLPLYYDKQQLSVFLEIMRFVHFDIFFVFMVVDSDRMKSVAVYSLPHTTKSVWGLNYLDIGMQLVHFVLQSEKNQVFHLEFRSLNNTSEVAVFDGSESQSAQVSCLETNAAHLVKCVTSSFLATVHILRISINYQSLG